MQACILDPTPESLPQLLHCCIALGVFLNAVVQLTEGGRRIKIAITAALDATDGNVRKVQKLSRHRKLDTLIIYDDNRGRDQQDVTEMLDGMF
ncbi:hypothetical protein QUA03_12460 [Microcoleus sp. S36b_A4]|uniref:hypothetical protein n=1 Tax=Microcoleus sp. S36b_A4 TaxID=3055420 RepID=UPI002FCEB0A3